MATYRQCVACAQAHPNVSTLLLSHFFMYVFVSRVYSYILKRSLVLVSNSVWWIKIISFMIEYSINVCLLWMVNKIPWVNTLKYAVHDYGFNYWKGRFFFFPPVTRLLNSDYKELYTHGYSHHAYHSSPCSAEGYKRMELHLHSYRCHSWLHMYHQLYLLYF